MACLSFAGLSSGWGHSGGVFHCGSHPFHSPCIVILGEDLPWLTQETRWLGFKSLISVRDSPTYWAERLTCQRLLSIKSVYGTDSQSYIDKLCFRGEISGVIWGCSKGELSLCECFPFIPLQLEVDPKKRKEKRKETGASIL